jgi:hypothetical protein
MWRVLGFGGKPNPLLYSRAASFASRTAQALLGSPKRRHQRKGLARGRLQLYVDDPIISLVGSAAAINRSLDLVLLWWLCLGIPLAWNKGRVIDSAKPYTWIGVNFKMLRNGKALMSLPKSYVKALLAEMQPFCATSGHQSLKTALTTVSRA